MIEYHSNFLKADSHSFFETTCKDRIEIIRRGIRNNLSGTLRCSSWMVICTEGYVVY